MESRKAFVDTAKFFGIIIVLMNHIGLSLPYINFYGGMFYVPIFFVAAGYTYKRKEESFGGFVKKKARRLLVPYFVCNGLLLLFYIIRGSLTSSFTGREFLFNLIGIIYSRNCLFPMNQDSNVYFMTMLNSPTWFLTALFLSYILFELSIRLTKGNKQKLGAFGVIMLFASVVLHYLSPILFPWSMESIGLFYCFLLAGFFIKDLGLLEKGYIIWLLGVGMVLFLITAYMNGSANISVGNWGMSVMLGVYNSIYSSLFILWLCKTIEKYFGFFTKAAAFIGRHTLSILCFHMLIITVAKTVVEFLLNRFDWELGVIGGGVLKFLVLAGTIALIVAAENLLKRVNKGEADEGKR